MSAEQAPALRPVDAASLIILDGDDDPAILMGRRSAKHAFMPSVYVFPGGRVDREDGAPAPSLVHPHDERPLRAGMGSRGSERRVRALARAAARETEEEVGLFLDRPDATFRYIARAITPPGRNRRFDTRFFCARREWFTRHGDGTDELEDVRWVPLSETGELDLHRITGVILGELRDRLKRDPGLDVAHPVPHHRQKHGAFVRLVD